MGDHPLQQAIRLFDRGLTADAEALVVEILRFNPENAEANHLLGRMLLRRGNALAAAVDAFGEAARLRPDWFEAIANQGIALARLNRHAEAERALRSALLLSPDSEPVLTALAGTLHAQGRRQEAEAAARRAVAVDPQRPEAWTNLGVTLQAQGRLSAAADAYQRAIVVDPGAAIAMYNLSHVRNEQWRSPEAWAGFRRAVETDPGYDPAWHAYLFNLLYDPEQTEETLFNAHSLWGQRLTGRTPRTNHSLPLSDHMGRRLRVGYVSPDFHGHSCAFFLMPLFEAHDRTAVDVYAYSCVGRPDSYTEWFRDHTDHWREIRGLSDESAAALIRADAIDVLVDLAGHTRDQPLGVFALQPAPVQVAWLGYPATTGLPQIGYRLTDVHADPPGDADRFHTETLIRLPGGFHCYRGSAEAPAITDPPVLRNGFVTFGSFNNISKITLEVVATWSEVLRLVPRSRLVVKGRHLKDVEARRAILGAFIDLDLDPARVELRGWMPRADAPMSAYKDVDVALDAYPFNGATTTFEALWMGVPVVTLRDQRHAGRVGASILSHLGRPDWIAADADEYVQIAVRLASDTAGLATLRHRLRSELAASSMGDAFQFARKIEDAYREMYRSECRNRQR